MPRSTALTRSTILGLLLTILVLPLGASPAALPALRELLPEDLGARLAAEGRIVLSGSGKDALLLMPNYRGLEEFRRAIGAEAGGLRVEALYLQPRPLPTYREAELRGIYATLLAISSLEGTRYYLPSKKGWYSFYAESYRIPSPGEKRRLPDPKPLPGQPLDAEATYYAFQRDVTFGPTVYACRYRTFPEAVSFESINQATVYYLGLPALRPHGVRIRLMVIQAREGLLFYVVTGADVPRLPILKEIVEESILDRADALFVWFAGRR